MFGRKTKPKAICFDNENQIPVIKCSICNGEQVAGLTFILCDTEGQARTDTADVTLQFRAGLRV